MLVLIVRDGGLGRAYRILRDLARVVIFSEVIVARVRLVRARSWGPRRLARSRADRINLAPRELARLQVRVGTKPNSLRESFIKLARHRKNLHPLRYVVQSRTVWSWATRICSLRLRGRTLQGSERGQHPPPPHTHPTTTPTFRPHDTALRVSH